MLKPTIVSLVPVPSLRPPRGLELLKSSAKFYANGAEVIERTLQLSSPVRVASKKTAAEKALPRDRYLSVHAVAMFCVLFLLLPSLALAVIVWWGTRIAPEAGTRLFSARLASSVDLAQTASNAQSDIIVHKVKTERIDARP
jgi:hypothetical protein